MLGTASASLVRTAPKMAPDRRGMRWPGAFPLLFAVLLLGQLDGGGCFKLDHNVSAWQLTDNSVWASASRPAPDGSRSAFLLSSNSDKASAITWVTGLNSNSTGVWTGTYTFTVYARFNNLLSARLGVVFGNGAVALPSPATTSYYLNKTVAALACNASQVEVGCSPDPRSGGVGTIVPVKDTQTGVWWYRVSITMQPRAESQEVGFRLACQVSSFCEVVLWAPVVDPASTCALPPPSPERAAYCQTAAGMNITSGDAGAPHASTCLFSCSPGHQLRFGEDAHPDASVSTPSVCTDAGWSFQAPNCFRTLRGSGDVGPSLAACARATI